MGSSRSVRVMADSPVEMALAFEAVLRYARKFGHDQVFTIGPFNKEKLMSAGMLLSGEVDGVLGEIQHIPNLTVTDQ